MQQAQEFVGAQTSAPLPFQTAAVERPLTVVGWLWKSETCTVQYTPEHANVWARMIHRHLTIPHRFVLLTDWPFDTDASRPTQDGRKNPRIENPKSKIENPFDPLITPIPLWSDWRNLKRLAWGRVKPYCYVRLKAFSEEARAILGDRFVSVDLDCVVLANLDSLFDRAEDFLIIRRPAARDKYEGERLGNYQASMWMMTAGARKRVWEQFKGAESIAAAARFIGSDQAWINHILPDEKGWNVADGVHGFIDLFKEKRWNDAPPPGARIVFFNGTIKPWEFFDGAGRAGYPWIRKNYQ